MDDTPDSQDLSKGASDTRKTTEDQSSQLASPTKLTSPKQRVKSKRNMPSLEPVMDGDQKLLRDIRTPLPGDVTTVTRKKSRPELSKQRSLYFEEVFTSKETDLLGDMVRSEAIVLAELKTNVVVHDEFTFVKELSQHLAVRYHRPVSSIVVTLHHSACIFFGGCCDPAYILTVEALSSLVQTATNKRNVVLLQQHMEQAIGVPASRGYVRFVPMLEECSGWKGKTVAGEITEVSGHPRVGMENSVRWSKTSKGSPNEKSTSPKDKPVSPKARPSIADGPKVHIGTLLRDPSPEHDPVRDIDSQSPRDEAHIPKTLRRSKSFVQSLFTRTSSLAQGVQGGRLGKGS